MFVLAWLILPCLLVGGIAFWNTVTTPSVTYDGKLYRGKGGLK